MIAPDGPHGILASVVTSGGGVLFEVDGRSRKISKGTMIVPLDPSGFSCRWWRRRLFSRSMAEKESPLYFRGLWRVAVGWWATWWWFLEKSACRAENLPLFACRVGSPKENDHEFSVEGSAARGRGRGGSRLRTIRAREPSCPCGADRGAFRGCGRCAGDANVERTIRTR